MQVYSQLDRVIGQLCLSIGNPLKSILHDRTALTLLKIRINDCKVNISICQINSTDQHWKNRARGNPVNFMYIYRCKNLHDLRDLHNIYMVLTYTAL